MLLGSVHVKAARKMLMKLTPDASTELTNSECVESTANDDADSQQLAEAEDVLNGRGQAYAQTIDQGNNS